MRILHTADWHLGRHFHHASLLDDQAHALDQLVDLATDARVDVVVVAGDVYDRSVPPADAVGLLDDTLHRLTRDVGVPVVVIAGNHDSATRLGFAARMAREGGLHLYGPLGAATEPLVLDDAHGPVALCPLPYADPADVRLHTDDDTVTSHDAAHRTLTARLVRKLPRNARTVAVGHCWVVGGQESESERPLTVGGTGQVDAAHFAPFHYTALGHLHRPQTIGGDIHYSGSLLKYSFSEATHHKSVTIVELDAEGTPSLERVELAPKRDVRILEGALQELLAAPDGHRDDYLLVRLTDPHAILDPMGKLRQVYPNVLHIERPGLQGTARGQGTATREQLRRSDEELFRAFYEDATGDDWIDGADTAFEAVLTELARRDDDGGAR